MRKIVVLLLVCILCILPGVSYGLVEGEKVQEFDDIEGHWAENAIKVHIERGNVSGYGDGTFKPDGEISIAEAATILNHCFGLDEMVQNNQDTNWFADELAKATYYGYLDQSNVMPNEDTNRIEVLEMLNSIIDCQEEKVKSELKEFTDMIDFDEGSRLLVSEFNQLGVIDGFQDNTFKPKNAVTRAEFLTMLDKITGYVVKTEEDLKNIPDDVEKITIIGDDLVIDNVKTDADVYISPGVSGDITFTNNNIDGKLIISGGNENSSIVVKDSKIKELVTTKAKSKPTIEVSGTSYIDSVKTKTESVIHTSGSILINKITTESDTDIALSSGTRVIHLTTDSKTQIDTESGAIITQFKANDNTEVKGNGTITRAVIDSENVSISNKPAYVVVEKKDASVEIGNDEVTYKNDDLLESESDSSSKSDKKDKDKPVDRTPPQNYEITIDQSNRLIIPITSE